MFYVTKNKISDISELIDSHRPLVVILEMGGKGKKLYGPESSKLRLKRVQESLALPISSLQLFAVSIDLYKAHCSHLQNERGSRNN